MRRPTMKRPPFYTIELKLLNQPEQSNNDFEINTEYLNIKYNLLNLGYTYTDDYVMDTGLALIMKQDIILMKIINEKMLQDQKVKELLLEYLV